MKFYQWSKFQVFITLKALCPPPFPPIIRQNTWHTTVNNFSNCCQPLSKGTSNIILKNRVSSKNYFLKNQSFLKKLFSIERNSPKWSWGLQIQRSNIFSVRKAIMLSNIISGKTKFFYKWIQSLSNKQLTNLTYTPLPTLSVVTSVRLPNTQLYLWFQLFEYPLLKWNKPWGPGFYLTPILVKMLWFGSLWKRLTSLQQY